jgi:bifunctional UDP-N-acetylglucosamine pyrophosphorylase / glucosamine-1-phosphate N-acetyltransferase
MEINETIRRLMDRGVVMPDPHQVFIDGSVDPDRISGLGVTLWPGSRIMGADTLILANAAIGSQGPATIDNCWIGPDVTLESGYFNGSVFLTGARLGACGHVRKGTILEEGAGTAHSVGLKQTILFPYVTLGSLINFCDILMAGGTGPKNHSEVGSAYIHFNFTPNQDKATPSLLGDVPGGVMLDRAPIFLGGQGGLVGPCRLAFGTVVSAGSICRKDEPTPNRLIIQGQGRSGKIPYTIGLYRNIKQILINNLHYIANLTALGHWYATVRPCFEGDGFPPEMCEGLRRTLTLALNERIRQLARFIDKLPESLELYRSSAGEKASSRLISQKEELIHKKDALAALLADGLNRDGDNGAQDCFLVGLHRQIKHDGKDYIKVIKSLSLKDKNEGCRWLGSVVSGVEESALALLPSFTPAP